MVTMCYGFLDRRCDGNVTLKTLWRGKDFVFLRPAKENHHNQIHKSNEKHFQLDVCHHPAMRPDCFFVQKT